MMDGRNRTGVDGFAISEALPTVDKENKFKTQTRDCMWQVVRSIKAIPDIKLNF